MNALFTGTAIRGFRLCAEEAIALGVRERNPCTLTISHLGGAMQAISCRARNIVMTRGHGPRCACSHSEL
eukprot:363966-Chlamydomonas_euryale.AAC.5